MKQPYCLGIAMRAAGAAEAAPTLTTGYYATHQYVVSATVSGSFTCLDAAGTSYDTGGYYWGRPKPVPRNGGSSTPTAACRFR